METDYKQKTLIQEIDKKEFIDNLVNLKIHCPNCSSGNYSLNNENHSGAFIYVDYKCEDCEFKFTVTFRAIDIDSTVFFLDL